MKHLLFISFTLHFLTSCVSMKVYREALAQHEAVSIQYKTARKELRTTEQQISKAQDSLKLLEPYAALLKKDMVTVQPGPANTDTNSAARSMWMSPYDRDVLYWLNVARLDPAGFFNRFILKAYKDNPANTYLNSLMKTMYSMKPVSALLPDKALYDAAMCHARNSGASGYVGHARNNTQCKKIYTGECCSYGVESALGVVIQLLVDEGVPGLGHRILCFEEGFTAAGIASATHKRYSTNTVIDFR